MKSTEYSVHRILLCGADHTSHQCPLNAWQDHEELVASRSGKTRFWWELAPVTFPSITIALTSQLSKRLAKQHHKVSEELSGWRTIHENGREKKINPFFFLFFFLPIASVGDIAFRVPNLAGHVPLGKKWMYHFDLLCFLPKELTITPLCWASVDIVGSCNFFLLSFRFLFFSFSFLFLSQTRGNCTACNAHESHCTPAPLLVIFQTLG